MKKYILFLATTCLLFTYSCTPQDSNTDSASDEASTTTAPSAVEPETTAPPQVADDMGNAAYPANSKVLSWVENLNIRKTPDAKGEVVAQAKENEVVTLTGKTSDQSETITLRGKPYTEPWVEVKTADGTTGWVFAGAVKKPGEQKGNALPVVAKLILGSVDYGECGEMTRSEFDCACDFEAKKGETLFYHDWNEAACIGVNGVTNVVYPDWEERDYKNDLMGLLDGKSGVAASGNSTIYFGHPLEHYKYADPVEFLTHVILASGKTVEAIPVSTTTGGEILDETKANIKKAIANAKMYMSKGGWEALNILKMDNRSNDVIVRYHQTTQYEGEANHYEGTITLLKSRSNVILETRAIKGTCGC